MSKRTRKKKARSMNARVKQLLTETPEEAGRQIARYMVGQLAMLPFAARRIVVSAIVEAFRGDLRANVKPSEMTNE